MSMTTRTKTNTHAKISLIALFALSAIALLACGGDSEVSAERGSGALAAACAQASSCGDCLAVAGCEWTGGTCSDTCLQDTYCYGPENPAAPTCPSPSKPIPATCDAASTCDACLAIEGCSWTGGICADTCLQDTDCYGEGNPWAPQCP